MVMRASTSPGCGHLGPSCEEEIRLPRISATGACRGSGVEPFRPYPNTKSFMGTARGSLPGGVRPRAAEVVTVTCPEHLDAPHHMHTCYFRTSLRRLDKGGCCKQHGDLWSYMIPIPRILLACRSKICCSS
jgi:hypothetical protein